VANEWREHPLLKGRFLPNQPDDLQVIVHDGGPQITRNEPEIVWVTVIGMDGDLFRGRVQNQPHVLQTVRQGDEINFVMPTGDAPTTLLATAAARLGLEKPPRTGWLAPLLVTDKYLQEREAWIIPPCRGCGLSELFDAPSDLMRELFPESAPDAERSSFTTPCPNCGAALRVESRKSPSAGGTEPECAAGSFLATGKLLLENMTAIGELLGAITDDAAAERVLPQLDRAIARHNDLSRQFEALEMPSEEHGQPASARFPDYLAILSDISVSSAAAQMNAAAAQARVPGAAPAIEAAMKKLGLA
jgi:hypothetical protein